jgi:hypothetical protein
LQSPLWDPGSGLAAASIRVVYFILRPVAKKVLFFLHSCKALLDPHHGGVWVVCGWCVGDVCMMCGEFKRKMAELVNQKELWGAMDIPVLLKFCR